MSSITTGDTETIRKLADILDRHRGDEAAWSRLGAQLFIRRTMDGYGNRRKFERERLPGTDLNYKYCYDLEGGKDHKVVRWGRKGFPLKKMPAIAAAYGVTLESIGDTLDGGELVPAEPDPAPARRRNRQRVPGSRRDRQQARVSPAAPPAAVRLAGVLSDQAIVAAAPYVTAIMVRLRDLAADGLMKPSGSELFLDPARPQYGADLEAALSALDGDRAARRWDAYSDMPEDERVWLIAALQADTDTTAARPDTSVGLAAAPAGCVRYP